MDFFSFIFSFIFHEDILKKSVIFLWNKESQPWHTTCIWNKTKNLWRIVSSSYRNKQPFLVFRRTFLNGSFSILPNCCHQFTVLCHTNFYVWLYRLKVIFWHNLFSTCSAFRYISSTDKQSFSSGLKEIYMLQAPQFITTIIFSDTR